MSITKETLEQHLKDPAVLCCRRDKGTVISEQDLEDPSLFDDMVDAGLVTLTKNGLTIEQVMGATLTEDSEALVQLTPELLDGIKENTDVSNQPKSKEAQSMSNSMDLSMENSHCDCNTHKTDSNQMIEMEIAKLEGLKLKLPVNFAAGHSFGPFGPHPHPHPMPMHMPMDEKSGVKENRGEKKVIHRLKKQHIKITDAEITDKTSIENGKITIDRNLIEGALKEDQLVKKIKLDVIKPNERHIYTDTIMDVCPIATKVEGELGEGITKVCDGVVFMLTGVDEEGTQVHEFGSSEGYLDEKMYFGHPGCADKNDIIIRCEAVIEKLSGMSRPGPLAAHKAQDYIVQAVRDELKEYNGEIVREEICEDIRRKGNPRVVLVKEIMGQGAMHDNVICPSEPCGIAGGQMNVDCGNVPIVLTSNQVRDGSIHALTCIGPSTKEMTRHYIREPLVERLAADEELDLVGVIFVGSPQVNDEKLWVSERLGSLFESLDIDGVIITTEGFGNNHIDFIEHIGQAGKRGIPVVGVSFCANQGQLVVGNKYADAMVEENMDAGGFEDDVAGTSCVTKAVAERSVQMLKNKMSGVAIEPAPKHWNNEVINANNHLLNLPDNKLLDTGTLH